MRIVIVRDFDRLKPSVNHASRLSDPFRMCAVFLQVCALVRRADCLLGRRSRETVRVLTIQKEVDTQKQSAALALASYARVSKRVNGHLFQEDAQLPAE